MATKLNMIQSEFKSLCDDIFKKYGTLLYKHIRISLFDSPYEILIKFTDFDDLNQCKNICSETFRLNKSEAILDYVNEGLHTAKNNNSTIMNTNIQLLQWNENSQNK